jgi:formate hydrogenlyase subunit 4
MADQLITLLPAIANAFLFLAGAPLLAGWIKWVKSKLQNRRGPSVLQPYRDLRRLFGKQVVLAENASPVFRATPYVVFAATLLAAASVPLAFGGLPNSESADVIVLVGFLGLARFFLALAGMDIGTAFGGMGSSREVSLSAFAEPALLMAVFTLALSAHSTNLSTITAEIARQGLVLRPSFLFAMLGFALVAIAESGRVPVDNPATHLELTMVHEAMILEYSGRHLALIEWGSQLKLMLFASVLSSVFFPWGIAFNHDARALAVGAGIACGKLMLFGAILVTAEMQLAKMRLFRVPQFLNLAFLLALLGILSHVMLESGT